MKTQEVHISTLNTSHFFVEGHLHLEGDPNQVQVLRKKKWNWALNNSILWSYLVWRGKKTIIHWCLVKDFRHSLHADLNSEMNCAGCPACSLADALCPFAAAHGDAFYTQLRGCGLTLIIMGLRPPGLEVNGMLLIITWPWPVPVASATQGNLETRWTFWSSALMH